MYARMSTRRVSRAGALAPADDTAKTDAGNPCTDTVGQAQRRRDARMGAYSAGKTSCIMLVGEGAGGGGSARGDGASFWVGVCMRKVTRAEKHTSSSAAAVSAKENSPTAGAPLLMVTEPLGEMGWRTVTRRV